MKLLFRAGNVADLPHAYWRTVTAVASNVGIRGLDGRAIISAGFALFAVITVDWWIVSSIAAAGAIAFAVLARRAMRVDRALRGTALSLVGLIVGAGVLVFATLGPMVLAAALRAVG